MDKKRIEGLFSLKRVRAEFVDAPCTGTILITRRGENNFMVKGSHEACDVVLTTN
jgi:3-hydroxyisobutyrate dehydrogenase-like beta-hydroxyacid dehydrogenase